MICTVLPYLVAALSATVVGRRAIDVEDKRVEAPSHPLTQALVTNEGLNLVQTEALSLATQRARSKPASTDNKEILLNVDARAAAAASVEAAQRAAAVTAEIMNKNLELELENEHLRKEGKIGNASFGQLMAHMVARSVPRHRVKRYNMIAWDVEYTGIYEEVLTFPKRRPWTTNVVIATLQTFFADLFVQVLRPNGPTTTNLKDGSGPKRLDWKRCVLFALFGFLYVGMAQWFFYVSVFNKMLPDAMSFANKPFMLKLADKIGQEDLLIQVMADQFLITPFVYFPIFYALKEVLHQHLRDDECNVPKSTQPFLMSAISNYRKNFWQDNLASSAIWFPADFIIFMAPMYLRMPLDHGVAFLWTMILSYMRGVRSQIGNQA